MSDVHHTFGGVLKRERARLELTQGQLAERVGTTQQNVGSWESDRSMPREELLKKLLEVFGDGSPLADFNRDRTWRFTLPQRPPERINMLPRREEYDDETPTTDWYQRELEATIPYRLKALLPAELTPNVDRRVEFGGLLFRADYISDKLCVDIKRVPSSAWSSPLFGRMLRSGMQQLLVIQSAAREDGDPHVRAYMLALVFEGALDMTKRSAIRIMNEARLLGLELAVCATADAMAAKIVEIETGAQPKPDDGASDHPDWGIF